MSNLVLGHGELGSEICNQTKWNYITRSENGFDLYYPNTYANLTEGYDTLINCVANTDTYSNPSSMWEINYIGVIRLVDFCNKHNKKLVHISTDYVYAGSVENAKESDVPVHAPNWYTYTKLVSDAYVQAVSNCYLLVRTSFKPNPFPYPKAITSQTGNFDYVDVIANLIVRLIEKGAEGVYNVGTERKTIYELAVQTVPDVIATSEKIHPTMPTNITMDISKMKEFLNEN